MYRFLLVIYLLSYSGITWAQRNCGAHNHYQNLIQKNPEFQKERDKIELQFLQFQESPKKRAVITIPVVFHVLYNLTVQNISDAQIQSQMNILNADFRKLNSDISLLPSGFSSLASDAEIQFCLAQQDPSGNYTTGIVRLQTTNTYFDINTDNAKFSASGGDNAWDATKYLNIWVVPAIQDGAQTGILGYAQFPGGPLNTDGVVIGYKYIGDIGTAIAPYNKGRTATHEVGHWLNLFHIWGDDNGTCSGSDLVNDTPNQADENYGCPTFPQVSCSNGPNGDLFMNYMDYTDDACMYMFTHGQKSRMQALFVTGGARFSITTSTGCIPGISANCITPGGQNVSGITTTGAVLNWTAVSGAAGYNVQYKLNSASTWTTVTSPNNTYSLTGLVSSTTYNYRIQTICTAGVSAYSNSSNFTTLAPTNCTNSNEPNNSFSTAKPLALNTNLNSMIASSTDKDYYKFSTTAGSPKVKLTLTNLPADYDMRLYSSSGVMLKKAALSGTASETITYNLASTGAFYYVLVSSYYGAFNNSNCYTLWANSSTTNWKLETQEEEMETKPEIILYPNPVKDKLTFSYFAENLTPVFASVYNSLGQRVKSLQVTSYEGENQEDIAVQDLLPGIYWLKLQVGEEYFSQSFLIEP